MSAGGAEAKEAPKYTKKDFESGQDVRWCPGCVDSAILAAVQKTMPDLGIPKEDIVFISGIGCSSRFPYYMNTYGFHTIHGRAPAVATGLRLARPDLKVFIVTGDGDGLSIGGNHMLHLLRRNWNVTILLFNNRIYGLTKGQYSPTSELGKVTKSTPHGSADRPVNPLAFALGCGATFVARTVDRNIPHMEETLKRAARHKGAAFMEILQNCNVYNDLAWNVIYDKEQKLQYELRLEHGKPLLFGPPDDRRAEEQRLAVLEPELVLELLLLVVDDVPREVVVDVTVLEDLHERGALVARGALERLLHVRDVAVDRARDERGAAPERERERVHRAVGGAVRRGLRDLAELARGRVLPLREAIDPVVEEEDRHVHVPAQHVQHVVAADRQPVAVPRHDEHLEIGTRQPEPGGDGRGAAVDRVEPVGVHVVRKPTRAADPRDEDDVLLRDAEVRHRLLHGGEDRVVPAPGAPPDVLVGLEVLLRVLGRFLRLGAARAHTWPSTSWVMASRISSLASGRPRTRLKPTASTRYSARSTRTS